MLEIFKREKTTHQSGLTRVTRKTLFLLELSLFEKFQEVAMVNFVFFFFFSFFSQFLLIDVFHFIRNVVDKLHENK